MARIYEPQPGALCPVTSYFCTLSHLTFLPFRGRIPPFTAVTAHEYPEHRPTERSPAVERIPGHGTGEDGATSGPGDGRGPLPATEGPKGRPNASEIGWHHEAYALSSQSRGRERFSIPTLRKIGSLKRKPSAPVTSFPAVPPRAGTQDPSPFQEFPPCPEAAWRKESL